MRPSEDATEAATTAKETVSARRRASSFWTLRVNCAKACMPGLKNGMDFVFSINMRHMNEFDMKY